MLDVGIGEPGEKILGQGVHLMLGVSDGREQGHLLGVVVGEVLDVGRERGMLIFQLLAVDSEHTDRVHMLGSEGDGSLGVGIGRGRGLVLRHCEWRAMFLRELKKRVWEVGWFCVGLGDLI